MILIELLTLITLFLTSQSQPVFQDRILTRMCDVHTSYILPELEMNNYGKIQKILNDGVMRQRVRIVKCIGLNAGWAFKSTITAKCKQNFAEVKLFIEGKTKIYYMFFFKLKLFIIFR